MAVNVSELKAGHELDALVAEKVMGWKIENGHLVIPLEEYQNGHWAFNEFNPSTNISAAWQVVEKMRERDSAAVMIYTTSDNDKQEQRWFVHILGNTHNVEGTGEAVGLPWAICLAALKAVEAG